MGTNLEIVQVTYAIHLQGEKVLRDQFEDYPITSPKPDDMPEPSAFFDTWGREFYLPGGAVWEDVHYIAYPCDWWGLDFDFVGETFDICYIGGLAYDCANSSPMDVFGDWATDLALIGEQMLREHPQRYPDIKNKPDTVSFLTLWEYTSEQDYWGEWNFDWTFLGILDPAKLKNALKDTATTEKG